MCGGFFLFLFFSAIVAHCSVYGVYIYCVCTCVVVYLYKILSLSVCEFVCSRFACSSFLLNFNINNHIIILFIFVLLQHFLERKKKHFALTSIFLYSILFPYYFFILCFVSVCVYFTCAKECSPFVHLLFIQPPHGIDF